MSLGDANGRIAAYIRIAGEVVEGKINNMVPSQSVEALSAKRFSVCKNCHNFKYSKLIKRSDGRTHPVFPETIVDDMVIDIQSTFCERKLDALGKAEENTGCGCGLINKTKSVNSKCPLDKW